MWNILTAIKADVMEIFSYIDNGRIENQSIQYGIQEIS